MPTSVGFYTHNVTTFTGRQKVCPLKGSPMPLKRADPLKKKSWLPRDDGIFLALYDDLLVRGHSPGGASVIYNLHVTTEFKSLSDSV